MSLPCSNRLLILSRLVPLQWHMTSSGAGFGFGPMLIFLVFILQLELSQPRKQFVVYSAEAAVAHHQDMIARNGGAGDGFDK